MIKYKTAVILALVTTSLIATYGTSAKTEKEGEWLKYSQEPNGDVYFFDPSRVETTSNLHKVWSRIRYKTSVMGASSYQSLLEIDCPERTERIIQNTFFSDKNWEKPAISTDKSEKPKRLIPQGSASERLSIILCDQ